MLNGRLNPETDHFTSISVRGKAVVDYIVIPHVDLKTCVELKVYTPSDLVETVGPEVMNLIDDVVDSLIIQCCVYYSKQVFTSRNVVGSHQQVKRLNRNVPVNFLSSEICHKMLFEVVDQLENENENSGEC